MLGQDILKCTTFESQFVRTCSIGKPKFNHVEEPEQFVLPISCHSGHCKNL